VLIALVPLFPPAMRIMPFPNTVAVCDRTAAGNGVDVAVQVLLPFQSSAVASGFVPSDDPPATSTCPLAAIPAGNNVAVWVIRPAVRFPPDGQVADVPLVGIVKTSVVASGEPVPFLPPVTSTLPLASLTAVCPSRAVDSAVVLDQADVDVLNSCTPVTLVVPPEFPPTINTWLLKLLLLLVSRVAVWERRAVAMFVETAVQEPEPLLGL
jgi:hypothetical protein